METEELVLLERIGRSSGIIGGPESDQGYVDIRLGKVYLAWALLDGKWHGIWAACGVAQTYEADEGETLGDAKQAMIDKASWFLHMLEERGMLIESVFHA